MREKEHLEFDCYIKERQLEHKKELIKDAKEHKKEHLEHQKDFKEFLKTCEEEL